MKIVTIMGTPYTFQEDDLNNPELAEADGVCRIFDKEILVRQVEYVSGATKEVRHRRQDHVVRHELVHAFAQECGVSYGDNEALVDWIAHIIPMINEAFEDIKKQGE